MPVTQETIVLHDFDSAASGGSRVSVRRRTTSRGTKDRYTIDIKAEPIVHVFDDTALGAEPAEAIREVIEKAVKDIGEFASGATQEFRRRAELAFQSGAPWAQKRYAGGRIGAKPPNQTKRLFNDSNRLSEGLFVRQNPAERSFAINAPANRLKEPQLIERLLDLVPILKQPARIAADENVRRAVLEAKRDMIQRATGIADAKRRQLRMAQLNAAKALLGLGRSFVGL